MIPNDATATLRERLPVGSPAPSCRIETGETRVARSAGTRPETNVTITPTRLAITIVCVANTVDVRGRSMPSDESSDSNPAPSA